MADESDAIRRLREGDAAAYAELVRAHQRIAFRTAWLIAGPAEAEEVTQVAFLKAYRALSRFELGRPFRPWLLRIVANEAASARRTAARRLDLSARELAAARGTAVAPGPAAAVTREESRSELQAAIDRLPPRQRDVVVCRYLLELSEQETATVLGLRPGTVKSRLSRALDRLRVLLDAEHAERAPGGRRTAPG
jgi:RNA polymerase sigma factor (sigma-70 family)